MEVEILARIRSEGRFASDVFRDVFRRERTPPAARGIIAERVLAVLRQERLLDLSLASKGRPRDDPARLEELALLGPERREELLRALTDPIERIEVLGSLPRWLALRMASAWGDEAEPLARALSEPPPQSVRANRSKIDREALQARLQSEGVAAERTELAQDGLTITTPTNLFQLDAFREGCFEVQDEGSQLVAELVLPPPKSAVLDFCAGAGGKTLYLAALLDGKGRVFAHDAAAEKLEELKRRARRAGASNIETRIALDGVEPVARVLVDAPCSGLGVLRRNPEARLRLDEAALARFPALQLEILTRAASWVAKGGRLIYATCTFLPEENDGVVQAFLQARAEFEIATAKELLGRARAERIGDGAALRVFPHRHGTDAFFGIVLRKRG